MQNKIKINKIYKPYFFIVVKLPNKHKLPIGAIVQKIDSKEDIKGALFCDGRYLNKKGYAELYEVIGDIYTTKNKRGMFQIPDMVERKPNKVISYEEYLNSKKEVYNPKQSELKKWFNRRNLKRKIKIISLDIFLILAVLVAGVLGGTILTLIING
jgi:hypothetical protein